MSSFDRLIGTKPKSRRKPGDMYGVVKLTAPRGSDPDHPLYWDAVCTVCGETKVVEVQSLNNFKWRTGCSNRCARSAAKNLEGQ